MICIAELFFDEWQHGWCNSGLIKLIIENTKEKIAIVGTRRHLKALSTLTDLSIVEKHEVVIPTPRYDQTEGDKNSYRELIYDIIQYYHLCSDDRMFFLSSRPAPFLAATELNEQYKIPMVFVQHAELDTVEMEDSLAFCKRMVLEFASENNSNSFLTYSPFAKNGLKGILSDRALNRFVFIHHPVDGEALEYAYSNTVGAYGACTFSKGFKKALKGLVKQKADLSALTIIRSTFSSNNLDYSFILPPNMNIYQKAGGFTYKEQMAFIKKMGWILMPYTKDQYILSASGIFADAVRYGRPVIGLNCSYLTYYSSRIDGGIGLFEDNVESLDERIIEIMSGKMSEKYTVYRDNTQRLKQIITQENSDIIKSII